MRNFLQGVSKTAYDLNARAWSVFDQALPGVRGTVLNVTGRLLNHPKTLAAAVLLLIGESNAAAAEFGTVVISACFHVNSDDEHRHAALIDNGQGPELRLNKFIATGCVTPLSNTTECEAMLQSNQTAVVSFNYCDSGACIPEQSHGGLSPRPPHNLTLFIPHLLQNLGGASNYRYQIITDSHQFFPVCMDDKGFAPGSGNDVCDLPFCNETNYTTVGIVLGSVFGGFCLIGSGCYLGVKYGDKFTKCWARLTGKEEAAPLVSSEVASSTAVETSAAAPAQGYRADADSLGAMELESGGRAYQHS